MFPYSSNRFSRSRPMLPAGGLQALPRPRLLAWLPSAGGLEAALAASHACPVRCRRHLAVARRRDRPQRQHGPGCCPTRARGGPRRRVGSPVDRVAKDAAKMKSGARTHRCRAVRGRRRAASSACLRRRWSRGFGGGNASLVRDQQRARAQTRRWPNRCAPASSRSIAPTATYYRARSTRRGSPQPAHSLRREGCDE